MMVLIRGFLLYSMYESLADIRGGGGGGGGAAYN